MSKILIVGHPQSGYQDVERLLLACGMGLAKSSRREGFAPQQISAMVCKAHCAPPLSTLTSEAEIQQIGTAAVWHGLALDLMLGNLEQRFWGWSDPNAIYMLEYWKQLDPTIKFVFVYGDPQSALVGTGTDNMPDDPQALKQRLLNWRAFNSAMVYFYNRNSNRSVLVHAQQAQMSVMAYLQQLRTQLDAPVEDPPAHLLGFGERSGAEKDSESSLIGDLLVHECEAVAQVSDGRGLASDFAGGENSNVLRAYLLEQLVDMHPEVRQLQGELQSVATLPLRVLGGASDIPHLAWSAMRDLDRRFSVRQAELLETKKALANSQHCISERESENASLRGSSAQLKKELEHAKERISALSAEIEELHAATAIEANEARREHNVLLSQLHELQEDFERQFLESRASEESLVSPEPAAPYGAADRVKRQLSYRLGALMIQRSRSVRGWIGMPWALLAESRSFKKERAERPPGEMYPLHSYRDVHKAIRVKQHLSYRLGSTLLKNIKSPLRWMILPIALAREVREFKMQRKRSGK